MTPQEAIMDTLKRISRNFDNDRKRLDKFDINFYALRKDGVYAGGSLWSDQFKGTGFVSRKFAVNDGTGNSRLVDCDYLHERPR